MYSEYSVRCGAWITNEVAEATGQALWTEWTDEYTTPDFLNSILQAIPESIYEVQSPSTTTIGGLNWGLAFGYEDALEWINFARDSMCLLSARYDSIDNNFGWLYGVERLNGRYAGDESSVYDSELDETYAYNPYQDYVEEDFVLPADGSVRNLLYKYVKPNTERVTGVDNLRSYRANIDYRIDYENGEIERLLRSEIGIAELVSVVYDTTLAAVPEYDYAEETVVLYSPSYTAVLSYSKIQETLPPTFQLYDWDSPKKLYTEYVDYTVNYADGEITRLEGGSIPTTSAGYPTGYPVIAKYYYQSVRSKDPPEQEIQDKDNKYRNRLLHFVDAVNQGCTETGMQKLVRAISHRTSKVYEGYKFMSAQTPDQIDWENGNEESMFGKQFNDASCGGLLWKAMELPVNQETSEVLFDIHAVADKDAEPVIWAVGHGGTILHYDRATGWSLQVSPEPDAGYHLLCLDALDDQHAYIAGQWGRMIKTTDGGLHWTAMTSLGTQQGHDYHVHHYTRGLRMYRAGADVHGWACGGFASPWRGVDGFPANNRPAYVYRTTDGGGSWDLVFMGEIWASSPDENAAFQDIAVSGSNQAVAVGSGGNIWVTKDGGVSWTQQLSGSTSTLMSVRATASDNIFAVGLSPGAVLCYDGVVWTTLMEDYGVYLYGLYVIDADSFCASGYSFDTTTPLMLYFHREDGAWGYRQQGMPLGYKPRRMTGLSAEQMYTAGYSGRILQFDSDYKSNMGELKTSDYPVWHYAHTSNGSCDSDHPENKCYLALDDDRPPPHEPYSVARLSHEGLSRPPVQYFAVHWPKPDSRFYVFYQTIVVVVPSPYETQLTPSGEPIAEGSAIVSDPYTGVLYVEGTDYEVAYENGTLQAVSGSPMVGKSVDVSLQYIVKDDTPHFDYVKLVLDEPWRLGKPGGGYLSVLGLSGDDCGDWYDDTPYGTVHGDSEWVLVPRESFEAGKTKGTVPFYYALAHGSVRKPSPVIGTGPTCVGFNTVTNRLYVSNFTDNTVSVVDGNTDLVLSNITVGNGPIGVGINSVTDRIYVANYADNTVSVIQGSTGHVIAPPVAVGAGPIGVGVNASLNEIYVANSGDDTVHVINGATNQIKYTATVGPNPQNIGVNTATDKIYVTNFTEVANANNYTVSAISHPRTPSAANLLPNGNFNTWIHPTGGGNLLSNPGFETWVTSNPVGHQLLPNPSFEQWTGTRPDPVSWQWLSTAGNWSRDGNGHQYPDGGSYCFAAHFNDGHLTRDEIIISSDKVGVKPGAIYEFGIWFASSSLRYEGFLYAFFYDKNGTANPDPNAPRIAEDLVASGTATLGYKNLSGQVTAPDGAVSVELRLHISGNDTGAFLSYIDNASIQQVTSASTYPPGWQWLGGTNYSRDGNGHQYSDSGSYCFAAHLSAGRTGEDSATEIILASEAIPVRAGDTHTFSIWFKNGGSSTGYSGYLYAYYYGTHTVPDPNAPRIAEDLVDHGSATGNYQQLSGQATAPTGAETVELRLHISGPTDSDFLAYIDHASVSLYSGAGYPPGWQWLGGSEYDQDSPGRGNTGSDFVARLYANRPTGTEILLASGAIPVDPWATYRFSIWFTGSLITFKGEISAVFYDAKGAKITDPPTVSTSNWAQGAYQELLVTAVAPANAATAELQFSTVDSPSDYDFVSHIDDASIQQITPGYCEIAVGSNPYGVGVNQYTNKIYVSNSGDGTVSVIDGTTDMAITDGANPPNPLAIAVGSNPLGVVVETTTDKIYVANYGDNTVSVIDGADDEVIEWTEGSTSVDAIGVGKDPIGACCDVSTNLVYVANQGSNSVSVIDSTHDTKIDVIEDRTWEVMSLTNSDTGEVYRYNEDLTKDHYHISDESEGIICIHKDCPDFIPPGTMLQLDYRYYSELPSDQKRGAWFHAAGNPLHLPNGVGAGEAVLMPVRNFWYSGIKLVFSYPDDVGTVVEDFSFEGGIGDWYGYERTTELSDSTDFAYDGTHSMRQVQRGSGDSTAALMVTSLTTPGQTYSLTARVLTSTGVMARIYMGDDVSNAFSDPFVGDGQWHTFTVTYQRNPASTVMSLGVQMVGAVAGNTQFIDAVSLANVGTGNSGEPEDVVIRNIYAVRRVADDGQGVGLATFSIVPDVALRQAEVNYIDGFVKKLKPSHTEHAIRQDGVVEEIPIGIDHVTASSEYVEWTEGSTWRLNSVLAYTSEYATDHRDRIPCSDAWAGAISITVQQPDQTVVHQDIKHCIGSDVVVGCVATSNDVWGEGSNCYGHNDTMAKDGNTGTFWLSIGNNPGDASWAYEWAEFDINSHTPWVPSAVPSPAAVNHIKILPVWGGMVCWIHIGTADKGWLGGNYLTGYSAGQNIHNQEGPAWPNGTNLVPYIAGPVQLSGGNDQMNYLILPQTYTNVIRLRLTFHNLPDTGIGKYTHRASLREVWLWEEHDQVVTTTTTKPSAPKTTVLTPTVEKLIDGNKSSAWVSAVCDSPKDWTPAWVFFAKKSSVNSVTLTFPKGMVGSGFNLEIGTWPAGKPHDPNATYSQGKPVGGWEIKNTTMTVNFPVVDNADFVKITVQTGVYERAYGGYCAEVNEFEAWHVYYTYDHRPPKTIDGYRAGGFGMTWLSTEHATRNGAFDTITYDISDSKGEAMLVNRVRCYAPWAGQSYDVYLKSPYETSTEYIELTDDDWIQLTHQVTDASGSKHTVYSTDIVPEKETVVPWFDPTGGDQQPAFAESALAPYVRSSSPFTSGDYEMDYKKGLIKRRSDSPPNPNSKIDEGETVVVTHFYKDLEGQGTQWEWVGSKSGAQADDAVTFPARYATQLKLKITDPMYLPAISGYTSVLKGYRPTMESLYYQGRPSGTPSDIKTSATVEFPAIGTQLLPNGNFEQWTGTRPDPVGWQWLTNSTEANWSRDGNGHQHTGSYCFAAHLDDGHATTTEIIISSDAIPVHPLITYEFGIWFAGSSTVYAGFLYAFFYDDKGKAILETEIASNFATWGYQNLSGLATAPDGAATVELRLHISGNDTGEFLTYIDDAIIWRAISINAPLLAQSYPVLAGSVTVKSLDGRTTYKEGYDKDYTINYAYAQIGRVDNVSNIPNGGSVRVAFTYNGFPEAGQAGKTPIECQLKGVGVKSTLRPGSLEIRVPSKDNYPVGSAQYSDSVEFMTIWKDVAGWSPHLGHGDFLVDLLKYIKVDYKTGVIEVPVGIISGYEMQAQYEVTVYEDVPIPAYGALWNSVREGYFFALYEVVAYYATMSRHWMPANVADRQAATYWKSEESSPGTTLIKAPKPDAVADYSYVATVRSEWLNLDMGIDPVTGYAPVVSKFLILADTNVYKFKAEHSLDGANWQPLTIQQIDIGGASMLDETNPYDNDCTLRSGTYHFDRRRMRFLRLTFNAFVQAKRQLDKYFVAVREITPFKARPAGRDIERWFDTFPDALYVDETIGPPAGTSLMYYNSSDEAIEATPNAIRIRSGFECVANIVKP